MFLMPSLATAFCQSCEWDGAGILAPGAHSARLVQAGPPADREGGRKAGWDSAVNKTDEDLCSHGADIIGRRDNQINKQNTECGRW